MVHLCAPNRSGQGIDGGRVDVGVGVEIEITQPFLSREPGRFDPAGAAAPVAVVTLAQQQLGQKPPVGQLLALRDGGDSSTWVRIVGSRSNRQAWSTAAWAACSVIERRRQEGCLMTPPNLAATLTTSREPVGSRRRGG
jgi:hypothetical protein